MNRNSNPTGRCFYCEKPVRYKDNYCTFCGKPNQGWREPSSSQCGNCHASLEPGDRFCRICGTRAGEGAYEPYQELIQCVYGPMPISRTHVCQNCGYTWTTSLMSDNENFCPQCGGSAPYLRKKQPFASFFEENYKNNPAYNQATIDECKFWFSDFYLARDDDEAPEVETPATAIAAKAFDRAEWMVELILEDDEDDEDGKDDEYDPEHLYVFTAAFDILYIERTTFPAAGISKNKVMKLLQEIYEYASKTAPGDAQLSALRKRICEQYQVYQKAIAAAYS